MGKATTLFYYFTSLSTVQNVFITVRYRTQELATGDGLRRVCRFVIFGDWHFGESKLWRMPSKTEYDKALLSVHALYEGLYRYGRMSSEVASSCLAGLP